MFFSPKPVFFLLGVAALTSQQQPEQPGPCSLDIGYRAGANWSLKAWSVDKCSDEWQSVYFSHSLVDSPNTTCTYLTEKVASKLRSYVFMARETKRIEFYKDIGCGDIITGGGAYSDPKGTAAPDLGEDFSTLVGAVAFKVFNKL
ncbi:hypothetical protein BJ138DRAFT_1105996 [Hygrophoropsis aurantiaca]|uniref:Uncharacterized protein n=1 Tax=Hygrophoropsis aurantiaca TaxID=72124 RepID=A0ACB7ZWV3_9AGAM|nr:hypothetical protein BJ138DRAFT_1105996 [Hygrophoropsis aurantiaca]